MLRFSRRHQIYNYGSIVMQKKWFTALGWEKWMPLKIEKTSGAASGAEGVEDLMMLSEKQPVPFCLLLLEEQKSQASFIYS